MRGKDAAYVLPRYASPVKSVYSLSYTEAFLIWTSRNYLTSPISMLGIDIIDVRILGLVRMNCMIDSTVEE
jgi:hypothetical protein